MLKTGLRLVAIGVVATLLLTGCIPGETGGDPDSAGVEIYWGTIPAPAEVPAGGLPAMPVPPADLTDEAALDAYLKAIEEYSAKAMEGQGALMDQNTVVYELAETAKAGGEQAVAAWQSLLVTAGVAVRGADGELVEINGSTGFGFPVTDPELRIHSALSGASGGLALTELAALIGSVLGVHEGELAPVLFDDLSASADPDFGTVFFAAGPAVFGTGMKLLPMEEVVLEWDQVSLVLRRLSAELAMMGATTAMPGASGSSAPGGHVTMSPAAGRSKATVHAAANGQACKLDTDPYAPAGVELMARVFGYGFGKTLEKLDEGDFLDADRAGKLMAAAGMLSAAANYIIKAAMLKAEFSLRDSPLIRTKTKQPGEIRDLDITFSFDTSSWESALRCLNLFSSFAGISIPTISSGPADNIGVGMRTSNPQVLRIGDGAGGSRPVTDGKTGKDGKVTFRLSGAPYAEKIPEKATPYERSIAVRAESNVEGNDFWKDMLSVTGVLGMGGFSALVSGAVGAISRMRILSHHADIPVRDWDVSAAFRVTLGGTIDSRTAWNVMSGASQCGPGGQVRSGTVSSRTEVSERQPVDVSALLVSGKDYYSDQIVALVPLNDENHIPVAFGDRLRLFEIAAANDTVKSHTEPGGDGLPALYQEPDDFRAGCADGRPGDYVEPASDCGLRMYDAELRVSQISAKRLFVGVDDNWPSTNPWTHCGPPLYPDAAPVPTDRCHGTYQADGGMMPSVNDIFDNSKTTLTIAGSVTCTYDHPGEVNEMFYSWTLTLCRLNDEGRPMGKC